MAFVRGHQTHKENCLTGPDGDLSSDSPRVPARSSGVPSAVTSEAGRPATLQTRSRPPPRFVFGD